MANRSNHYEAAFESYLRAERIPYVAVDEQRRSLSPNGSLKNVDFILSPEAWRGDAGVSWLIDVKGRRFPSGRRNKQYWRNWVPEEELRSLLDWSCRFGPGFDAALVFAFHLVGDRSPVPPQQVHYHRDEPYAFVAAPLEAYRGVARTLSPRWGTVSAPVAEFRRLATPIHQLICQSSCAEVTLETSAE